MSQFYVTVVEDYTEELVDRHGPFNARGEAERLADQLLDHYATRLVRSVAIEVVDEHGEPVPEDD